MKHNYALVSGYSEAIAYPARTPPREFFDIWLRNRRSIYVPTLIVSPHPNPSNAWLPFQLDWITTRTDLGHQCTDGFPQNQRLAGWSAALVLGALHCYHDGLDMIFKEQDCLAFGPWVDRLYSEIGDFAAITGKKNKDFNLTANSLILVKWKNILDFVSAYISQPESDAVLYPERKFEVLIAAGMMTNTTMGVDRSRPLPFEDECWYGQHFTTLEVAELRV